MLKICINLGKISFICCKLLINQTFLVFCLVVSKYVCTFATQLRTKGNNKHNENNKQQTAAVIAAKWRRKTLNRLNVKLYTCKGGLNSTEHYNRTCKANKRNATTKNGKRSTPLISGYKVASLYLIPTINNKGMKRKENNSFVTFYKNAAPPRSQEHNKRLLF